MQLTTPYVAAYAPTEASSDAVKTAFWCDLHRLVARIPLKEYVFVLMDANARTGKRVEDGSTPEDGVLGPYGRDHLNHNGTLLLTFAADNNLVILNTFFSTRKGGISHPQRCETEST